MGALSDQEDLSARRISDEVKQHVLSWAKWMLAGIAILAAILGFRAYGDYQDALKKMNEELTRRVEAEVRQEVAKAIANYEKFTAKIIESIVEAEARQRDLKRSLEGVQTQVAEADSELTTFRKRLSELGERAEGAYRTYSAQLTLTVSKSGISTDRKDLERQFAKNVENFAREIGLVFDVKLVFKEQTDSRVQALFNEATNEYEVNPEHISAPDLPKYAVVMGHFLAKNFKACKETLQTDFIYWNDFRYGISGYLLQSEKAQPSSDLFKKLKALEAKVGSRDKVQRLAVKLLNAYQCDWKNDNAKAKIMKVNAENSIVPPSLLESALSAS